MYIYIYIAYLTLVYNRKIERRKNEVSYNLIVKKIDKSSNGARSA